MKILITGTAGFIGFHVTNKLLLEGHEVIGIDSLNDYYDVNLKFARLKASGIPIERIVWDKAFLSEKFIGYKFIRMNLENEVLLNHIFEEEGIDIVINLAAQAGVRYSLQNPRAYIQSNVVGFINILEASRTFKIKHLIYASSSSVYGLNTELPFSPSQNVDKPASLYAATKKANELMAHSYSHLYDLPTTGLRLFTVYGNWGRPDMAYYSFTKAIVAGDTIEVYNDGKMKRDFTHVSDVVDGIASLLTKAPFKNENRSEKTIGSSAPYRILNLGNNKPVSLLEFIKTLESSLNKNAVMKYLPMQNGDVEATWADIGDAESLLDFKPSVDIKQGLDDFAKWYLEYEKIVL
ncbi:NAD-dependent epimerase/dehydratase family protein [Daejeonella sp.]|uniref:NAD-dependent epimerase/dehydratase family protein n=1 Tax=Daejeonella sp. TaxID=2805397 RepID=UPI0030BFACA7